MAESVFLTGRVPYVKEFSDAGVKAYPLIKKVTSHTVEYPISLQGFRDKLSAYKDYADRGACLLKGGLLRELNNESRAGQADKGAMTHNLVLDIDGLSLLGTNLTTPMGGAQIRTLAENVVSLLPDYLQNVSYIAHASASLGLKGNKISMHLDFMLQTPIAPEALKRFLTHLNFQNEVFTQNLSLTATGKALKFPVDRCLADNSRLIFIAPPQFKDVENPIPDPDSRIFAVEKAAYCIDLHPILQAIDFKKNDNLIRAKIKELRTRMGLSPELEKTQKVMVDGKPVNIVKNPDLLQMVFFADHGNYVTYNLEDGDSHGYYVKKSNPQIVWNFKGESPFIFEAACPEAYQWHIENFGVQADESGKVAPIPLGFRDVPTNTYYNGLYNPKNRKVTKLHASDRSGIADYVFQEGGVVPETPPQWEIIYDPNNPIEIDFSQKILNKWSEPILIEQRPSIEATLTDCPYSEAHPKLETATPWIHRIIWSILGCNRECYEHFINWLAYIVQYRDMTQTSWLWQGVPGTGKGMLWEKVLTPMFKTIRNTDVTFKLGVENAEEQFNSWIESALMVFVDEVRVADNNSGQRFLNKVKSYITEPHIPMRSMRSNVTVVRSRCNFIFTSNQYDPIKIEPGDRRWNVAPRQEVPLFKRYPGCYKAVIQENALEDELPTFISFLMEYNVDAFKATKPLENRAKQNVMDITKNSVDEFTEALQKGDLRYFAEVMEAQVEGPARDYLTPAQNYFRAWVKEASQEDYEVSKIWTEELRPLYNILVGNVNSPAKFGRLLTRKGFQLSQIKKRIDGAQINRKGVSLSWNVPEEELIALQEAYLLDPTEHPGPRKVIPFNNH